jgi:hypothetical protein
VTSASAPNLGVSVHRRLRRLPFACVCGRWVPVAIDRRARLLGLAGLSPEQAGPGLLIPRCRSVHTFGMRFALDVVFLDDELTPLAPPRRVVPGRVVFALRASAVLELPAPGAPLTSGAAAAHAERRPG